MGPKMAPIALSPYHDGPRTHFVSNVDGADIADMLAGLNPETTLVIVASKTFHHHRDDDQRPDGACDWMTAKVRRSGRAIRGAVLGDGQDRRLRHRRARVFGLRGLGRRALFRSGGPIGLVADDRHRARIISRVPARGGAAMDAHFRSAPLQQNMPVMLALVGIWHHQGLNGYPTRAVLPYDNGLSRLPAYLQQLEMESNGKRVSMDGIDLTVPRAPVVWGRARHQWPARLLSADPSGRRSCPANSSPPRRAMSRRSITITSCCWPIVSAQSESADARPQPLDAARAMYGEERA